EHDHAEQAKPPTTQGKPQGLTKTQALAMFKVSYEEIGKAIGQVAGDVFDELAPKIAALGERVKALEASDGGVHLRTFRGYWTEGKGAGSGEFFTFDGRLWIALRDTNETPAATSPDWCLAARKGRDGR